MDLSVFLAQNSYIPYLYIQYWRQDRQARLFVFTRKYFTLNANNAQLFQIELN